MRLETPAEAVRRILDIYRLDLEYYMDNPDPSYMSADSWTEEGLCHILKMLFRGGILSVHVFPILLSMVHSRVGSKLAHLCVTPLRAKTHSDMIRSYQARINLLEEILFDVTPVEAEEVVGTFEKFNNVLY